LNILSPSSKTTSSEIALCHQDDVAAGAGADRAGIGALDISYQPAGILELEPIGFNRHQDLTAVIVGWGNSPGVIWPE